MPYQPNKEFCASNNMPYPAPEHLWHPNEFTFQGLQATLTELLKAPIIFQPPLALARNVAEAVAPHASVQVPVNFSPSNAVTIGKTIKTAEKDSANRMFATFFFESTSPSYDLNDPRTTQAMAELANGGHEVGLMLVVTPDTDVKQMKERLHTDLTKILRATSSAAYTTYFVGRDGATPEQVDAMRDAMELNLRQIHMTGVTDSSFTKGHTVICDTQNGIYEGGHPVTDFVTNPGHANFVFKIADSAFSKDPKWALDRLGSLPEVDANVSAVRSAHLDHAAPTLGMRGTYETVPEHMYHANPSGGFRVQRHEMS